MTARRESTPHGGWFLPFLALFTAAIFAVDVVTPLGITVTTLYVPVVLAAAVLLASSSYVVILATICSALTIAGFFLSPSGAEPWHSVVDRGLVLFVLWETTVLSLLRQRAEEALRESHQQLEQRVEDRTTDLSGLVQALRTEISQRVQTEHELRCAKELAEEASRTKSDFLATMSHELRSPLNVIIGYGDLLAAGEYGPVTPEQSEVLDRLGKNAWGLFDLISSVMDLSRLESGRMPVELKPLPIAPFLAELEDATREIQAHSGLAFTWTVAPDLPTLNTDRGKLQTILRNLIGNAVRYTPTGSIRIAAAQRDGGVEFSVTDTGVGIPREAFELIFDAFRQLNGNSTRAQQGAGLGLHIVKRLTELLGGRVSVESEVGRGSTFRVWLPS